MNGELVREKRESKGWTQRDLAAEAQIPQSFLSRIETGARQSMSIRNAKRLAAVLGVSTDDLLADPQPVAGASDAA